MALVFVLLGIFSGNGTNGREEYKVAETNIVQSVVLSGKVETSSQADLGFAASGRVGEIYVKNNERVVQDQILAQLEIADLMAELKIKQANLKTSNIDLEATQDELEKVVMREDIKMENAYRNLLSEDLTLIPDSDVYSMTPPSISGIYNGKEGRYKILIDKPNITFPDFRIRTFGLESTTGFISSESPTMLGTKGLYITFPSSDLSGFQDTIWYLDIPNRFGSSYLANYNAYNEAIKNREIAIQETETKYKKLLAEEDSGGLSIAQAEIQKINAEIRKNTIYAPFTGKVTNIEKEVGENASVGERVISILGEEKLEVVLQVSELDVSRLAPDQHIKMELDALPGEIFYGTLETINSRETEIDGVPVYEAFVEIPADSRIRAGMSATGTIVLAERLGVVALPVYFIEKTPEGDFVEVLSSQNEIVRREIQVGLVGSDNIAEIIAGLAAGETVISQDK